MTTPTTKTAAIQDSAHDCRITFIDEFGVEPRPNLGEDIDWMAACQEWCDLADDAEQEIFRAAFFANA